ncbi:alpha/beta hydrolase [Amycolatopsis suaedae]|uniref:Alpha/beta hydrolase n=1 Tax=Amycolatopsis suaedae TaxID=2510978 RepID=A0A4Q7J4E9_9PSEU|nr:alpha/beta hydrolase [Amycolatopsis suaedae]
MVAAVAVVATAVPAQAQQPLREVELGVTTSDGQVLPATLRLPPGATGPAPAIVLVHGAGPGPREDYRAEAEAFARKGIATLAYDKRTDGYSMVQRDYAQLAGDAVAAAGVLRGRPEIQRDGIGFLGISEGGWVAPMAATRDPDAAFVITVGASGVSPLRQQSWAEAVKAEHGGLDGSIVDAFSRTLYRLISGLGMFPEAYHDPAPALRALTVPVLGIWGAKDIQCPPVESAAAFRSLLAASYTLRTFDGAEHALRTTTDGYDRGPDLAPGYPELVASWVGDVAAGHTPPTSAEGTGLQTRTSVEVPPLAWYESVPVQIAALLLMLAGFLGFALSALWRRAGSPWPAWVLAATGTVAALGAPVYLGWLQFTAGGTPTTNGTIDAAPLLAGRPLVWLGLQALAVIAVASGVATAVLLHRRGTGGRVRHGLLLAAGAVFAVWAFHWGLLLP